MALKDRLLIGLQVILLFLIGGYSAAVKAVGRMRDTIEINRRPEEPWPFPCKKCAEVPEIVERKKTLHEIEYEMRCSCGVYDWVCFARTLSVEEFVQDWKESTVYVWNKKHGTLDKTHLDFIRAGIGGKQ